MSLKKLTSAVIALLAAVLFCGTAHAGNIDATNKYAWGTNIGWLNFSPSHGGGVSVYDDHLEGYVWNENIGWISLGTFTAGTAHTYANSASAADYGVNNNGSGLLSGYGWSTNAGWVNFKPTHGGVTIGAGGSFDGYAWAENIGWIHFKNAAPAYNVVMTCMPGDIDADGDIGLSDAVRVLRILTAADKDALCQDADVNNDGQIGIQEAVFILKELAK